MGVPEELPHVIQGHDDHDEAAEQVDGPEAGSGAVREPASMRTGLVAAIAIAPPYSCSRSG